MWSTLYSCRILIKLEFFSTDFRKKRKYQVLSKSVHWQPGCSVRTEIRADLTKLIVAFRNLANAPKSSCPLGCNAVSFGICVPYYMTSSPCRSSLCRENLTSRLVCHVRTSHTFWTKGPIFIKLWYEEHALRGHCTSLSSVIPDMRPCKLFKWKRHMAPLNAVSQFSV